MIPILPENQCSFNSTTMLHVQKSESPVVFTPDVARLVIHYVDGRAYILDLNWLDSMNNNPIPPSAEELIHLACEGPFSSSIFEQSLLAPYLDDQESQLCR